VNKTELIDAVVAHTGHAKSTVADVIGGLEDVVVATVHKGEKVALTGFVSFERVDRKARTARNPQTGAEIQVPASKAPKVSAGASFKNVIKGNATAPSLKG
jgi:DNA-binding protein HU-beta